MFIVSSDRAQAEKTITMYQAIQELETRIQQQKTKVEQAEKEAITIEKQEKKLKTSLT